MVKVTFEPYEELVTDECQKFELNDMVRLRCAGIQVGSAAPDWLKAEK